MAFLAMPFPSREELAHLRRIGIDPGDPVPLRVLGISEDDPAPGRFRFDEDGKPHIVAPVIQRGEWVDLVAFGSKPERPAMTLFGVAWALGADALTVPMHPEPVPVMRHPIEWLRARGAGACFVDWTAARAHLSDFAHAPIEAEDLEHSAQLRRALQPRPVRAPRITTSAARRRAASREAAA
ncbi:hypothetical protein [Xanthobacter flavus]|uniref:hypothetical protein n=1 Tax=Xanthobacter flavus TaxID=281 RepID=UPI003729509A